MQETAAIKGPAPWPRDTYLAKPRWEPPRFRPKGLLGARRGWVTNRGNEDPPGRWRFGVVVPPPRVLHAAAWQRMLCVIRVGWLKL